MIINGAGLQTDVNYQINKKFEIETKYAIKFFKLSNGGYGCIDRASDQDNYQTVITVMGKEASISSLQNTIEANRVVISGDKNVLLLSGFNKGEKIFGADIDYDEVITVTPTIERRAKRNLNTFSIELRLYAQNLSFILPTIESFPDLNCISNNYNGDTTKSINKIFSLNNSFYIQDHDYDKGSWKGTVMLTNDEMVAVRYQLRVNRGSSFAMPNLVGVSNPFGIRGDSTYVRLLEIEDENMVGYNSGEPMWQCKLSLAEEF